MFGFLTGIIGLVVNGIGPLFTWLTSRDSAKTEIAIAQINAYLEAYKVNTQFKIVQFGWWGTRVLLFLAAIFPIYQASQIYLDSCAWILWWPHEVGSWRIPKPPAPYDTLQTQIILSFFAIGIANTALSALNKVFQRKSDIEEQRMQLQHRREMLTLQHSGISDPAQEGH